MSSFGKENVSGTLRILFECIYDQVGVFGVLLEHFMGIDHVSAFGGCKSAVEWVLGVECVKSSSVLLLYLRLRSSVSFEGSKSSGDFVEALGVFVSICER